MHIRCPDDANDHCATAAVPKVAQVGKVVAETRVNLRIKRPVWTDVAALKLTAGDPCEITIGNPAGNGALILAEVRFIEGK